MSPLPRAALLLLFAAAADAAAPAAASFAWQPLACPAHGSPVSACAQAPLAGDAAVVLFYQMETQAPGGGAFSCADDAGRALCARDWANSSESGAAGSCFFLLAAGRGFACTAARGAVNMIDANYALLAAPALAAGGPAPVACPAGTLAAGGAGCELPAAPADRWVHAAWAGASVAGGAFACTPRGASAPGCAWASDANGPTDASSCAFLLPAGVELDCAVTRGAVAFAPASATALLAPLAGPEGPSYGPCPPASPKPNDCDCGFAGNKTDAIVSIVSTSVDGGFNSFHCYVEGSNVCGWGSNLDSRGSLGSCTFILPAGQEYACQMEWGAAAFPAVQVMPALRSLWGAPATARAAPAAPPARRAAPPAPAGGAARLARLFAAWRAEHGASFADGAAEARARAAFAEHVAAADAAAPRLVGAPHVDANGLPTRFNRFAATPRAEWEAAFRGGARGARGALAARRELAAAAAAAAPLPPPPPAPPAFDWRDDARGVVSAVKDQGQCGSCWTFSTTESVESAWAVAGNPLVPLSEQYVVSCDTEQGGCDGGFPNEAVDWLRRKGAVTEASWPYASGGGDAPPCTSAGHVVAPVNVTGWRLVPGNTSLATEAALAAWLAAYGPVSIVVDAMTQLWWVYNGGVMTGCCDVSTDHAVVLVGFNATAPVPYWIIRNSWGESWGEGGYVRLASGSNECGIGTFPIIPTVAGGALPPPPPPPPPRPVWECAPDAKAVNTSQAASCVWVNGTSPAWFMPSADAANDLQSDCTYLKDGYLGYTFSGKLDQSAYPCPPSFSADGDGGAAWFCTLSRGQRGFVDFPAGATALCDDVDSKGVIGYSWPL